MQDEPIDEKIILDELSEIHKLDYNYSDGRILGSMCTEAHPFAIADATTLTEAGYVGELNLLKRK